MASLKGKTILITGGSRGIGAQSAKFFAEEGAKLAITYLPGEEDEAKNVCEECATRGAPEAIPFELDLLNTDSIEKCVQAVADHFGSISILINNAGVLARGPIRDQSYEDIEWVIRVNLEGLIKITKAALPYIKDQVINIASSSGHRPHEGLAPYCATKYGVRGFTQTLALEEPDLLVFNVNPGKTATAMTDFEGVPVEDVARILVKNDTGPGYPPKRKVRARVVLYEDNRPTFKGG